ncbi:MAG: hypothetical protein MJ212_04095 [Alphaproteobacteria bacterium]|nr:hypothetical protein [Alphaproteobacteria bacterium]
MKRYKGYNILAICTALCLILPQMADAQEVTEDTTPEKTSFTEYVQQNNDDVSSAPTDKTEDNGTWIDNLVSKVAQKSTSVLSSDSKVAPIKRSNASVFDIAGIMLRMDRQQIEDAMKKRGYQKIYEHLDIPNFIRWRYEDKCRRENVIGYERIMSCVHKLAEQNNYQYVQEMKFSNFQTQESIDLYLTSNFTGNKVYRIMYETEAANVTGSGAKAEYLRNMKVFDFWKKINQKYGHPDNKDEVSWGLGDKKPYLRAKTGKLLLEDPMLLELDYTRMSREDKKFMNTSVYTF